MADYFTTFVQNLLGNPAPRGSMFSGLFAGSPVPGSLSSFVNPSTGMIDRGMLSQTVADYYADPFRLQNAINQRILEEELKKAEQQEILKQMIIQDGGNTGYGSPFGVPSQAFNFAPVDDYSSYGPGGYTGDTGSGTIGNTGVGIDSAAVGQGNEGAGLGFGEGAFGGGDNEGGVADGIL